ncbi:MAG: exo-alpha-sialidase [Acidobacteria bacterium]|nr:exo-alpha-sialidase [Acidobacteriota bacterium]
MGMSHASAQASAPFIEKRNLFVAETDGYALYRIPGIIVTRRGSILAWCEARKRAGSDWGTTDIQVRHSTDGGKTFDAPRIIANVEGPKQKNPVALAQNLTATDEVAYNNPVMIADHNGVVHFLFCLEYMRCFYARSTDDGKTFSKPVEITSTFERFRSEYNWKVLATGPGHGLQLKRGRLIVPIWLSEGTGGHAHRPSVNATIYSDDHGKTWQRGAIIIPNTSDWVNPSEAVAVELTEGRVMFNSRSESRPNRRLIAYSQDGATNWTKPSFHNELIEPVCLASLIRLSEKPSRLLFVNPNNLSRADGKDTPGMGRDRKNISVRLSYDEGQTWPVTKVLEPGPSAYSDLAVTKDGTILCLYENGFKDRRNTYSAQLTLARFNLEWLTDGKDKK